MEKLSGSDDAYDILVEQSEEGWLLGLLAFAVFEEQRIEWCKHQKEHNGGYPTPDEIKNWYEQQPHGVLLRTKDTAETRLKDFSNEIVDVVIEEQEKEIEQGILVQEIRDTKKFLPQFIVNFAGGFASTFIFALLLAIFAFFIISDKSPSDIGVEIRKNLEENNHGEERSNK